MANGALHGLPVWLGTWQNVDRWSLPRDSDLVEIKFYSGNNNEIETGIDRWNSADGWVQSHADDKVVVGWRRNDLLNSSK
jgi:hypothetical protein